ncbi:nuclear transport factor 2 family protein [Streptomyces bohaiensis]|uniref:Nuclear transport factor 2 family protein n=1 Tax=Streptomyces bohaiensis TaxID=1431344 RepID=A0ABX1C9S7_9ACTN|nr:nuclear transport factor 2 family protein [Streptomyces bohaiensis]NJQ14645.1 nuclear transport factor 2 family protein [Streptomyces bohaiensis]
MAVSDEQAVRELEGRRFRAIMEGDLAAFRNLAHPDLTYTHSSGALDTLESFLEKCESAYFVYHRIDHVTGSATVVGDTAVVVGDMRVDMTAGGTRRELSNRSLGVWVRMEGKWRILAHQATAKR